MRSLSGLFSSPLSRRIVGRGMIRLTPVNGEADFLAAVGSELLGSSRFGHPMSEARLSAWCLPLLAFPQRGAAHGSSCRNTGSNTLDLGQRLGIG